MVGFVRAGLAYTPSPEEVEDVFDTACLAWIEPESCRASILSAGHPRPLLIAHGVTPLDVPVQGPLGLDNGEHWEPTLFDLPGDCSLFFYTDGLVEGLVEPGSRERWGEQRLVAGLASVSNGELSKTALNRLVRTIEEANGMPLPDDVTALALARRGPG